MYNLRLPNLIIITAAVLALSGAQGLTQEPIRMGVLEPLTGPFTKNGSEHWEAMQIARDMINERGGISGRKIELIIADAPSPAAQSRPTARSANRSGTCHKRA